MQESDLGNILVLQPIIIGHSTIIMAMRYAHFAPIHLDAAVALNPFGSISESAVLETDN